MALCPSSKVHSHRERIPPSTTALFPNKRDDRRLVPRRNVAASVASSLVNALDRLPLLLSVFNTFKLATAAFHVTMATMETKLKSNVGAIDSDGLTVLPLIQSVTL